ncbi:MAG: phage portal protein [Lentimicrobium sp.]|jgi:hypothetical protein|nr:phage portal protein [Lentimicrobium sp.]
MDALTYIEKMAGKPIPPDSAKTEEWLSWYRGYVHTFHSYPMYNGMKSVQMQRKSMGMAKQVCESWANLLMNERCDIIMPDKAKEKFDEVVKASNFWLKANDGVEKSFALGIGAFVVSVRNLQKGAMSGIVQPTDKSYVNIDFVNRLKIKPITVENKEVTECAFITEDSDKTHVVVHLKGTDGKYLIHNAIISDGKLVDEYVFDTKSELPYFQIIRPNISSNILSQGYDPEIGISIFANSIDTLMAIDNKYDAFDFEYIGGRKRLFIKSELWNTVATDGGKKPVFDPNNTLFQVLPDNMATGQSLIKDESGELRADAYITGLNSELNTLSMKCGLGETYYKMNGSGVATATQVISENSTLYRSLKKHEILFENVLHKLTLAIIHAQNTWTKKPIGDVKSEDIKIVFDDSIIEDKGAEMERDKADVSAGLMSNVEYRMKWYGEDEETAIKNIREYMLDSLINRYLPALTQGAITPEDFCIKVYGEATPERVAYIREFALAGSVSDMAPLYDGDETGSGDIDDESQEN